QSRQFTLDDYGNVKQTALCGGDTCTPQTPGARVTSTIYNDGSRTINGTTAIAGQFVSYSQNAEGHKKTYEFDPRFGKPTKITNHSGLSTCTQFDSFGRTQTSTEFCGSAKPVITTIQRVSIPDAPDGNNNVRDAAYLETSNTPGGAFTQVYFDILNRERRKQTLGFKGKMVAVDTQYDQFGRIRLISEPYPLDEVATRAYKQTRFDVLDRVREFIPADGGSTTTITYQGNSKTTTRVVNGQTCNNQEILNVIGQTEEIIDAKGESTQYHYYASGLLHKTIDPLLNEIVLTYDARGNKKTMQDPDMGAWSYTYTPFDELETQTDAKKSVTFFKYDKLSRPTSRVFNYGTLAASTSSWVYDTAEGAATGLLHTESDQAGYQKTYLYDNYGRLKDAIEAIPGHSGELATSWAYDDYSRVRQITYPGRNFSLVHHYSANTGQLTRLQSNDSTPQIYWSLTDTNARGQIKEELFGNRMVSVRDYNPNNGWLRKTETRASLNNTRVHSLSYDFDDVGSINWRQDNLQGLKESFTYDVLDRIETSSLNGATTRYAYDELGNLTSKSDTGTYRYNETCGGLPPGPHAVTRVDGPQGHSYCYDANGNMTADGSERISYTPDNKPNNFSWITSKDGGTHAEFSYSPSRNRYKKTAKGTSLYYLGQDEVGKVLYEKEVAPTGTQERHYLYAGDLAIGVMTRKQGQNSFEYYHRDHLNSVEAVTNQKGEVVTRKSFDTFGRPRQQNWTNLNNFQIKPQEGSRGYTGHEHIDETGLIHMNGRVYNPILGRFLSADPTIQFAKVQQSYNRYSYVSNNPLKYTDMTGYEIDIFDAFNNFINNNETNKNRIQENNKEKENLERKKSDIDSGATSFTGGVSTGGTVNSSSQGTYDPNLGKEVLYSMRNAAAQSVGNMVPDSVNGAADWMERFAHTETGSLGHMDKWVPSRNPVADSAVGDLRAVIGVALMVAPMARGPGAASRAGIETKNAPPVKWSAQEKHFPGHNSYTPGRSTMTSNPEKLAERAGSGQQAGNLSVGQPGSKERVNFGEKIGDYFDPAGNSSPTTNGIIHYSKDGIHIVPARPEP
ncbi:MAG: hypothetical protein RL497_2456, partial [Pseudomonadota bacterium]